MSDLSILIKALLDPDSTKNIETQIKNLQALFDKSPLKVKLDVDNVEFKAFSSNLQKLSTELNKSLNINSNTGGLDKYSEKFVMITGQAQKQVEYTKEFTNNLGQSVKEINKLDKEGKDVVKVLTTITDNFKQQRTEQEKLVEAMAKGREKAEAQRKALDRKAELAQAQAINKAKDEEYAKTQKIVQQQKQQLEALNLYKLRMLGNGDNIVGEIDIFAQKNKGKYDPEALKKIRADIEALNINTPELNKNIKQTSIGFSSLKQQAAQSGNVMTRALENAMKFLRFYLVGGTLVGIVRTFKESISVVKELDVSLTELNKVADLTENQLADITKRAYEVGVTIGRTGKEVIDATAEWVRAGYNIEDAFNLSQQSLLLTNIGDGITDVKEASSSLIAILKGFKMDAESTAHVVDVLNEVSNKFALDTNNLTEILKRTSGTIAQTGTSYEQLIGLATGGFESLRNAEMVASGINMISQRLRGMEEDGTKVTGLIPKIQEAFDKYTGGAVSVIDKQNGGLNDTYTILQQLSKVYPTLTDEARAYINEAVAGNRQNKVLVAILENWQNVESAIKTATESTGSAVRENEKYLASITGKISQFKSETQQMWANAIDSNVIKFFVDLGTSLIKIIDGFGLWNTAILVATASLLLLSKSFLAFYSTNIAQHFLFIGNAVKALAVNLGVATGAATALGTAMTMIAPIAIVVGIMGAVSWIKYLSEATERQIEKVRNLKEEYDSLNQSLEDTESKQQQVIDRLKELYDLRSNNKITNAEKEELTRLENVNTELERQIKYEQALKAIKGEELERETLKLSERTTETSEVVKVGTGRGGSGQALYLTASQKLKEDLDIVKSYTSQIKKIESAYDKGEISAKEYGKQLEKLKLDRQKQIDGLNELIKKLQEENQNYVGATKEGNAKKVANEALIKTTQDYIISLNQGNEVLSKLNKTEKDGTESNFNYAKSLEEVNKVIDTAQSELKDINTLIKDNGELTAEQVLDAIQKYDLLPEQISKTTDGYKIQESALEDLRKQQIKTTEDSIQAQVDDANNVKIQTAKKLEAYGFEIQTLKDIADAKKTAMGAAYDQANKQTGGYSDGGLRNELFEKYYKDTKAYEEASKAYQEFLDRQKKYLELLSDPSLGITGDDKKSKYTPSTEESALKALYDAQEISLEIYLQRLITLEKTKYSEYSKMSAKELESALRSRNESVAKKASEYLSLSGTISDLQYNKISLSFQEADKKIKALDNSLSTLGNINTIEEKAKETEILGEKFRLAEQELKKVKQQLTDTSLSPEIKELLQDRKIKLEIDIIKFKDSVEEAMTELLKIQQENDKLEIEVRYKHKLEDAELDIYGGSTQAEFEEISNRRIERLQQQIDRLQEQSDLLKEQEIRNQKLLDIEKAKLALEDAKKLRVKTFVEGKGWVDTEDSVEISKRQDEVSKLQEDYAKWESDLKRQKRINDLRDEIKHEQDKQKNLRESLEEQKRILDAAQKIELDDITLHYQDMNTLTATELENLKITYGNKWDEILKVLRQKLSEAERLQRSLTNIDADIGITGGGSGSSNTKTYSNTVDYAQILNAMEKQGDIDKQLWNELVDTRLDKIDDMDISPELKNKYRQQYKKYDTGGLFPSGTAGINVSGKPEYVLNPDQTKSFIKLVGDLPKITEVLKKIDLTKMLNINMPKFPTFSPIGASDGNSGINIEQLTVYAPNGATLTSILDDAKRNFKVK